jgi:NADH-quinone oxidoreductase subunit M
MNNEFLTDWGLTLMVFLPAAGALVMLLIPKAEEQAHKWVSLVAVFASAAMGVAALADFNYDRTADLQFVVNKPWIDVIHARYFVGIDGLSVPLVALTLLITPLCIIYSWNHFPDPRNAKAFLILLLVLQTGMLGTFVAQDLILFFVFFEVVLLPMYFLIGVWGAEQRQYAAIKFFLFTLFGSALMIISFLALFFVAGGTTFAIPELAERISDPARFGIEAVPLATQVLIFGGMFMGFGIKVPIFPFHTWLPDAHTQAPTVGSVILAAILLKLGTYGFIRVALPILPEAAVEWAPYIGALAVIGIIYGALACLAQTDMKRLIAFSSVSHMGFVMLGIATLTDFGLNAAVMGMVAHGIITGMLFFLAGSHGLDPRVHRHGLAGPARARRVLGRVPGDPVGLRPRRRPVHRDLPGLHGHRRPGDGVRRRLPAVALPADLVRPPHRGVRGRGHRRRAGARVDRLGADAGPHPRDRRLPQRGVPRHGRPAHGGGADGRFGGGGLSVRSRPTARTACEAAG